MTSLAESFVSMKRIEEFLLAPERKAAAVDHINFAFKSDILWENFCIPKIPPPKMVTINQNARRKGVVLKNVTARWGSESQLGITECDFEVHGCQLVTIDGPVGSGKSTILMVIIRELDIDCGALTVNGVVSYSSQEPWLFDSTVRQNILFTEEFDEKRYLEVIRVCSLERDFQSLPVHDMTIVGESGICLSGGQKARINLARAVYRRADIYLLDDPLSAVDSAVAKSIFNNCIKDFLKDKICILVTHQEQYFKASNQHISLFDGRARVQKNHQFVENGVRNENDDRNSNEKRNDDENLKVIRNGVLLTHSHSKSAHFVKNVSNHFFCSNLITIVRSQNFQNTFLFKKMKKEILKIPKIL